MRVTKWKWGATLAALTLCLASCTQTPTTDPVVPNVHSAAEQAADAVFMTSWTDEDTDGSPDVQGATVITLSDSDTTVQGAGATAKGSVVTVHAGGVYVIRGSLSNGQLRVDSADDQTVRLVLSGVDIHSQTTAPLFVKQSAKTVITLAAGSQNTLSDAAEAVFEDTENEEPSGALFSKSDLTINGDGALAVTAAFRDGIVSRDGLKFAGGQVTVTAVDDAVMGRDYVMMRDGDYTLTAEGDGVKSTNDGGDYVGFVQIEGGTLAITSAKDGVQALTALRVDGGDIRVNAGGGHQNGTANSANDFGWGQQSVDSGSVGKGLKAGTALTIAGGSVAVDSADDAIHSNGAVVVSGGTVEAASGDDGVHADVSVTVDGGTLTVTHSYEALEAATITLNGGEVALTASDDGVNASSGTSGSTGDPRGQSPFAADDSLLLIHGGRLTVDAGGDGLDSNGKICMDGGDVYVCGPSNSGNGTFDFGAGFEITGGTLIGVGSLGMAETPTSNTQNSIVWSGCSLQSGDAVTVTTVDGNEVIRIASVRTAQWAYVTSPLLQEGENYTLADGVTEQTVTLNVGVNTVGTAAGGFGGPGMGGGPGGHGGHGGFPGGMPPEFPY